jgi:hypothetical protein
MLISLITLIHDLSRRIDLHQQSMMHTDEKAIAGKTGRNINPPNATNIFLFFL